MIGEPAIAAAAYFQSSRDFVVKKLAYRSE
jgi:hypothetical protein